MTKEEKQQLLVDLCARLPYRVKVHVVNDGFYDAREPYDTTLRTSHVNDFIRENGPDSIIIEPYLRPLSSMTEGEKEYLRKQEWAIAVTTCGNLETSVEGFDWLNAHHFDYRGLIGNGALEAPEGMYNLK